MKNFYVEEPTRTMGGFLPDNLYAQALESFIIDCVDFVPVDPVTRKVYLARRIVESAKGIWRFGGRRRAGEQMGDACVRLAQRELGLTLSAERFSHLIDQDCVWSWREQLPRDKGCHTFIHVFGICMTQDELAHASVHLDEKEYDTEFGIRSFSLEELCYMGSRPQLIEMCRAAFP